MANYVLEILDGDRAGEVVSVADRALRIGRKPGNDVVLADEKTSGVHAEIVLEGDRHVLRDLGSTNGTFLDGKRLTELVLTPGDVVTLGRLRVKFRSEGEAAADAGELAVRQLDKSRLQRRGGSLGLYAVVVVLGLGAAGWFWWSGRGGGDVEAGGPAKKRPVLQVAGNKLPSDLGGCENEDGWNLRAAGGGFQPSGQPHTGEAAFLAQRAEGADAADFAVLRKAEALPVFAGRTMTVAAHLRTAGGGQAALRVLLSASNEQVPFRFLTGTPMQAADGWQRCEVAVGVPSGCDRLTVEVAAVLPGADATVAVDDVAVTEAGNVPPLEAKLTATSQVALGTGSAIAVRSVDLDNLAILLGVLPDAVPPALQGLHKAELCCLSDLGAGVTCTPTERGFQLAVTGASSLQFVLPADAAGGLMVGRADGSFASAPADGDFQATAVLVGDRLTRALFRFESAGGSGEQACRGKTAAGRWRLSVPVAQCELVLGFRAERQQAADLVSQAAKSRSEGRPGEALDRLRELIERCPLDSEVLGQGLALRAELLAEQGRRLQALQQDFEVASFFSTRGGFARVVLGVDELLQLYDVKNLEDKATPMALRDGAVAKLAAIDGREHESQRKRLESLAKSLRDAAQEGLAQLVQGYVERNLRK